MNMFDSFQTEVDEFDALLEKRRNDAARSDDGEAFSDARGFLQRFRDAENLVGQEFGLLARFFNDCVPWDDELVRSWQRLEKKVSHAKKKSKDPD